MSHIRDNLSHMCHFVTHVGPEATTGIPSARPVSQKPYCSCDRKTLPHNPPASRRSRRFAGPSLPWFSRSATQHKSCQLEFFSKKSFRQPVLACFVLVPAPAAPRPPVSGSRPILHPSANYQAGIVPTFSTFLLLHHFYGRVSAQRKTPEGSNSPGVLNYGYDPGFTR